MGNGYEHIQQAFTGQLGMNLMVLLIFAKIAATNLTIGSGGWGGDFAPLLFIGAMLGGSYGQALSNLLPGLQLSPGAYAMVGMGALLTATIRCPITAILLLFELTGSYAVILPVMTACAVATPIARRLIPRGMYHQRLQEMGGPAGELPETRLLESVQVGGMCRPEAVTLAAATPFREILRVIATSDQLVLPVVDEERRLLGALTFKDLRGHLDAAELADLVVAADVVSDEVPALTRNESLGDAMHLFAVCDLEELPVVEDRTSRRLIGLITRRQAMAARERVLAEWEMEDL
jgi:CIC family chloride channel protein